MLLLSTIGRTEIKMVFFTCNACGESLKKANVEKHYLTKCRACEVLSCIDCGKDFHGDGYKDHTTCISEDQKYGGKNFKATPHKGAAKQNSWIEIVREASMNPSLNPKVRNTLKSIINCGQDNIPRKKGKFMNFVKNSMHVRETWLVEQVWKTIEKHVEDQREESTRSPVAKDESSSDGDANVGGVKNPTDDGEEDVERAAVDADKNDKRAHGIEKRKRQGDPLDEAGGERDEDVHPQSKKKKKKKKKREDADVDQGVDARNSDEDDSLVSEVSNGSDPSKQSRIQNGSSEELGAKGKKKRKKRRDREVNDEPRKTLGAEHNQSENDCKSKTRKDKMTDDPKETHKPDQSIKDKKSKKKRKGEKENGSEEVIEDQGDGDLDDDDDDDDVMEQSRRDGGKFQWDTVITEALRKAGGEIRIKKLKKKVFSEYFAQGGDASITSQEKLFTKFNKKVMKNPKYKVHKEMVHLKL